MTTAKIAITRTIREIALEVKQTWVKPYYGAVPYIEAMLCLRTMQDMYGFDTAESVVQYFLANASGFRGEDAKRIKTELKALLR